MTPDELALITEVLELVMEDRGSYWFEINGPDVIIATYIDELELRRVEQRTADAQADAIGYAAVMEVIGQVQLPDEHPLKISVRTGMERLGLTRHEDDGS